MKKCVITTPLGEFIYDEEVYNHAIFIVSTYDSDGLEVVTDNKTVYFPLDLLKNSIISLHTVKDAKE